MIFELYKISLVLILNEENDLLELGIVMLILTYNFFLLGPLNWIIFEVLHIF